MIHFTQDIQVPMNPFCANTLELTVAWYHRATIALRELTMLTLNVSIHPYRPGEADNILLLYNGQQKYEVVLCKVHTLYTNICDIM